MSRPTHRDACQAFRWEESARAMGVTADAPVNLGRAIVDRHAGSGRAALRWFGKRGEARTYTFDELAQLTARFANVLRERGVGPGYRVAGFLPRISEMLIAMIGTWKVGAVYVPIFTGFGTDAIEFRVLHSGARVLVTQWEQRGRLPEPPPDGVTVITVAGGAGGAPDDVDFWRAMDGQPDVARLTDVRREDPAVLLYTSGSTGPPKGVKIAANFLVAIHPHLVHGADLRPDDVFWPTGDPGWGYGLVCYMGALALGVPVLSHEATPAPEFCLARLRELGVTNLATTPTLLRGVMALGAAAGGLPRMRSASSCGEPLNAEVVRFFHEHWGVTVRDQYGSSEFGLPIGNFATMEMVVKPGSMGLPLPGCAVAVVDDEGHAVGPDVVGHVGMKPHPEGYYWFEGRADDVIKSAGYRIGPFEVESAILKHPAVAEAAVVGKPDALRGQIVKAYVVLKPGRAARGGLEAEIVDMVKTHVGRHQYPREIEFLDQLPKTETGKIQRFLLRGR
jgi:acetyl-CoA synthetase